VRIIIQTIPHNQQRYSTCGDWIVDPADRALYLYVSIMGNPDSEFAVAIHEMIEAWACLRAGISQTKVDEFDKRAAVVYPGAEPGDLPDSPYLQQHVFATEIEKRVIAFLAWQNHENAVDDVYDRTDIEKDS
jgi:hypothetical protein